MAEQIRSKSPRFSVETGRTTATRILTLVLGILTSVILARALGPEGRGIYALAMLLPALIVNLGSLGIAPATVYFVARGQFRRREILGGNIVLSLGLGAAGVLTGLVVIVFFGQKIFPGVPLPYLFMALALIPVELFFSFVSYVLLGAQDIKGFNVVQVIRASVLLGLIVLFLPVLNGGVNGAVIAGLLGWVIVDIFVFRSARKVSGGLELSPNTTYIKRAAVYGFQSHLSNILGFLNYRIDMFLVNGFLGSAAVGFYAVGVGLVEKLWMISSSASVVLFPRVAAESDERRQKDFTPLVTRTVLWITSLGALLLIFLGRRLVLLFYSRDFLPAVGVLKALLIGIVALSATRILSNDIAGRGRPILNAYRGAVTVLTNVILNLLWIPRFGITGAAWASTASYTVSLLITIFMYSRISGNPWTRVILLQRGDVRLYWRTGVALVGKLRGRFSETLKHVRG